MINNFLFFFVVPISVSNRIQFSSIKIIYFFRNSFVFLRSKSQLEKKLIKGKATAENENCYKTIMQNFISDFYFIRAKSVFRIGLFLTNSTC